MDNGAMRVLYRRGPEGTPFHTMCLEGLIDGPITTGKTFQMSNLKTCLLAANQEMYEKRMELKGGTQLSSNLTKTGEHFDNSDIGLWQSK
jgi:hypothetical protein